MKLLWKLLRQHISVGQFTGFVFANLFGMIIILAGYQFYNDIVNVFYSEDSFMKANYIMVTKHIGTANTFSGRTTTFSENEIEDLSEQNFVKKVAPFTSTNYKADAHMSINGQSIINTELFFESVPDSFVDIDMNDWKYDEGSNIVPIILPRSYINMYNFGFARNHSLPQISEGLMGMIEMTIAIHGNGKEKEFRGKVVAFSSTLNSILVPQAFMDWSNSEFSANEDAHPTRLLMEVTNPTDEKLNAYFEDNGLDMESDKLEAEKMTYFLRMVVSLVMIIGLTISVLSFYILILSIYLLLQKNTKKLQNLLLIGYTCSKVALPYQLLTALLNLIVLAVALVVVAILRSYYMNMVEAMFPELKGTTLLHSVGLGMTLFILVTTLNVLIIRRKINRL